MGAWGHGIFEDDTSCDALCELAECPDIKAEIERMTEELFDCSDDYIEYDTAQYALAAAAAAYFIADGTDSSFFGEYPPDEMQTIKERFEGTDLTDIIGRCASAVRLILGENSELRELWEENDELYEDWKDNLKGLAVALDSVS